MVLTQIFLFLFVLGVLADDSSLSKPNIIFVMLDDVGFADLSYNNENKMLPTPNIDKLVADGIKFDWHYSHPTCTPSRASLITGKYSTNAGLSFAMLPGSPVGLPMEHRTMPQLLREQGYAAHMVGKWHLGFATWAQTPVGRGFETHIGNFNWDITSYGKQIHREPWVTFAVDWIECDEKRQFKHFAEPRHATIAITAESVDVLYKFGFGVDNNKGNEVSTSQKPLFLYTAYNAAHAPLQPTPEHEKICNDLTLDGKPRFPHLWRKQFCGMVVGLDEGVGRIADVLRNGNGRDTVFALASDNGGSTWFGGLNYPLRSGKLTVYEGGCRVPAFAVDFSTDKRFFGPGGRTYGGLMHFSDWLPTFLGLAGVSGTELERMGSELHWDGVDQGPAIRAGAESWKLGPRKSVLYDLSLDGESVFENTTLIGYRYENWKCVAGVSQDPFWYSESTQDRMNSTDTGWVPILGYAYFRFLESIFGNGPVDTMRTFGTSIMFHSRYRNPQVSKLYEAISQYLGNHTDIEDEGMRNLFKSGYHAKSTSLDSKLLTKYAGEEGCGLELAAVLSGMQLYDLDVDPEEKFDVAKDHPDIVEQMTKDLQKICLQRPQQQKYWLTIDLEWSSILPILAKGDCSMNPHIKPSECRFQHPFLEDDFDPNVIALVNGKVSEYFGSV